MSYDLIDPKDDPDMRVAHCLRPGSHEPHVYSAYRPAHRTVTCPGWGWTDVRCAGLDSLEVHDG